MTINRTPTLLKQGEQYGRLTLLEDQLFPFTEKVQCKCTCGTEKPINVRNLRYGRIKSCGCINREILASTGTKMRKHHLKPGDRYGRLTITNCDRYATVSCDCDCGGTTVTHANALIRGNTKSCGCLHRDMAVAMGKRNNSRGGISEHTLYGVWERNKLIGHLKHEPWLNDPVLFITEVEQEIGPRPAGRWFRVRNGDLGVAPGNIYWGGRKLNAGHRVRLTLAQKREVAELVAEGYKQVEVANAYRISTSLVSSIVRDPKYAKA
jgi:hypothetical protein